MKIIDIPKKFTVFLNIDERFFEEKAAGVQKRIQKAREEVAKLRYSKKSVPVEIYCYANERELKRYKRLHDGYRGWVDSLVEWQTLDDIYLCGFLAGVQWERKHHGEIRKY